MSSSDFPTSFDVVPAAFDGIDFLDADTLNPLIQGARNCQLAIEEKPYAPQSPYSGILWFWASVKEALQDLGRIEVAEVDIGIPTDSGNIDIRFRNPGRFNKTNANGIGFIIIAQRMDMDGDSAFLPEEYPDLPNHPVTQLNYDGSGDVEGFRIEGLPTSGDYLRVQYRYFAMEVDF